MISLVAHMSIQMAAMRTTDRASSREFASLLHDFYVYLIMEIVVMTQILQQK